MPKLIVFLFSIIPLFAAAQSWKKLHHNAILIDTHNDVISTVTMRGLNMNDDLTGRSHSDITRLEKGGVDIQVFSIFSDERFGKDTAFKYANIEIDSLYAIVQRNPARMMMVFDPSQLQEAVNKRKIGCMMGLEGGHMIEDNLEYLDSFYKRGVRYMTLTWNNSTSWATSAWYESTPRSAAESNRKTGLNDFGKSVIRRMNELGMIVDVSHVGEQTFFDAIAASSKPVIASHSNVHRLCPVPRNLKDEQIRAIGRNGGVIHLNFYSGFVDSNYNRRKSVMLINHKHEVDSLRNMHFANYEIDEWISEKYPEEVQGIRPTVSQLLDHLDYIVRMIGIDHVGIGSDFDGIESAPHPLDDVTSFPLLTRALRDRGYSKKDVKKILGENFIRVFKANQQ